MPVTRKALWLQFRRIWVTFGVTATVVFVVWSLIAYRASPQARQALSGDGQVKVAIDETLWSFDPAVPTRRDPVGLLFFPGALVEPAAYAPLAHALAAAGHPVRILPLPRRGAFGGADDPRLLTDARSIIERNPTVERWVVGGHSRGAVVASTLAADRSLPLAGLVLIGSSHPRDVDLSRLEIPVTKIVSTRDGLATPSEVRANGHLVPPQTTWHWIEGGNHSQFGWYGFQPGDRRALMSADSQHLLMIEAVLQALEAAGGEQIQ